MESLKEAWEELSDDLPLGQRLLKFLRLSIIRMDLRPGQALSEKEIAQALGVSRQPVREAFLRLSEAGLIDIRPQRGSFVVHISQRAVYNARFVREAIEVSVVAAAAETGLRGPALNDLRDLIARQRLCVESHQSDRFFLLDEEFHKTLALAAGNPMAWHVIEGIKAQLDRVRYLCPETTPIELLVGQHIAILDAVADRDVMAAIGAMQTHLRAILLSLPGVINLYPDAFCDLDLPPPPSQRMIMNLVFDQPTAEQHEARTK